MITECISCHKTWSDGNKEHDDELISHGLCHGCMINMLANKIRAKQVSEGYTPCFGQPLNNCDWCVTCKYKECCSDQ